MNENKSEQMTKERALLVGERFTLAAERIAQIRAMSEEESGIAERYVPYFRETAALVYRLLTE